jgi:short-subunit dehydrogenase
MLSGMSGESGSILITGASSGIGLELARVAAAKGRSLILVARSGDRLAELARSLAAEHRIEAEAIPLDLGLPESPAALFEETSRRGRKVSALVNNAGFGSVGLFHEIPLDRQLEMLRLNIVALTHLTHLFLPAMVSRREGRVLNVGSTAGLQPGPLMAVYYASKAYVLSFSEALTEELRGTGVTVTALLPGPTRTDFQQRAGMAGSRLTRIGMADARPVAELGYRAMEEGRAVAIPGLANRLLALTVRVSPRAFVRKVAKRLNQVAS